METSKDFEVYRTDPSADPNPANWVTEIYIPIK
jgi:predicted transcriptional regulator YdeE